MTFSIIQICYSSHFHKLDEAEEVIVKSPISSNPFDDEDD